jgi:hypothetical protein
MGFAPIRTVQLDTLPTLVLGISIVIRVTDPAAPAAEAGVGFSTLTLTQGSTVVNATTQSNGTATVTLPSAGVWSLHAEHQGFLSNTLDISAKGGATFVIPLDKARVIDGHWVDTQVFCGDVAKMTATVTPAPADGTSATVAIFVDGGAPVQDKAFLISVTINGGTINGEWPAKTASAAWRTDSMRFRVILLGAGAQTADSTNLLTFKGRTTTGVQAVHNQNNVASGPPFSVENHDASLDADRVHYRLRIAEAAAPSSPAAQTALTNIQNVWNGGFANKVFHRVGCGRGDACDCTHDCCKVSWNLDVSVVPSGQQHVLGTFQASPPGHRFLSGTNDTTATWADPPQDANEYAHEVGHILGQFDEYTPNGVNDPSGVQPAPPPAGEENLMAATGARLLVRHYRWALRFLNSNGGGDVYKTVQL